MRRTLLVASLALAVSGCAYRPSPTEVIRINDSPVDMNYCRRLAVVSDRVPTVPGFADATEAMLAQTVALGGTDLLLLKRTNDWLLVRGIAYRCPGRGTGQVVVRAAG